MGLNDQKVIKVNGKLKIIDERTNEVVFECDADDRKDKKERCPICGSTNFHGACCYRCGYPSNMAWVGEQTDLQHHHR